ncbi:MULTISPECIES: MFS transporter [unclassified Gordonia (in: high G+C Gram-positive bacteria)]|uniref:MFS transporter n=1 Tax=unclassified Gordonia (in: high G+C Gram-positive bacteria) TaxID=2657482 RepID=UPI00071D6A67|nr:MULTISPECIES: MFS transporter [unclassified Gordonia (in: high G+C Gram-positive bacteria)]KSU55607.1 MFS transporter [Gordonia sp. SGD-V-85]SCC51055.1 MFS transporter, DHA3 family, tetracycline resistance protein [Gordonia sp. v-85]
MNINSSDRLRALRPLATRDYRLLFAAVGIEVFGTGMWTIVMVFQVLALDNSPLALSAVATGLSLGLFTFSIAGGVIADRFSKRRIIITVQGCTAVVMTAVAAMSLTGAIELWHIGLASFAMGAGSAFFYPAYSAYLPQVLPPEQLLAANGLEGALRPSMGQGLGPALGGIVVGAFFPAIGAVIVAASYAIAFIITLFLSRHLEATEPTPTDEHTSIWGDLRAGVRYVAGTRWLLWTLIFGSSLALIIQGPIEVLLPFLTRDRFEDAEATFGLLLAAYGIGGAAGSLVISSLKLPRRYLTLMIGLWGGGALPLVLIGFVSYLPLMLAALFAVGAATGAGVVIWGTLLQRLVPPEMIGRVASLDFFVSIAFMPVSIAIAGPLSLVLPIPVIFIVAGITPTLLAAVALLAGRMRQIETRQRLDT